MKKIILSAVALFCLPLFALADSSIDDTATSLASSNPPQEEQSAPEDNDIQMHCVFTTCTGTVCDEIFSNEEVKNDFIEEFDKCYDKYQ